jgi:hypothetical protein
MSSWSLKEFPRFPKLIDAAVPKDVDLHPLLDNDITSRSSRVLVLSGS